MIPMRRWTKLALRPPVRRAACQHISKDAHQYSGVDVAIALCLRSARNVVAIPIDTLATNDASNTLRASLHLFAVRRCAAADFGNYKFKARAG
jgi:hypothetical protein